MPLSSTQVSDINAAYNAALLSTSSDASAGYYNSIAPFFSYGEIAAGVVQSSSLAGITAQVYLTNKVVNDFGATISAAQRHDIMIGLMQADYEARAVRDPVTNNVVDFQDISYDAVANYHYSVYQNVLGTTPDGANAWILYDVAKAESATYGMTTAPESMYVNMVLRASFGDPTGANYAETYDWAQDMRSGVVWDRRDNSLHLGDRVALTGLTTYLGLSQPLVDKIEKTSMDGASATNPFYSSGFESMITDIAYSEGLSAPTILNSILTDNVTSITIDVSAANSYVTSSSWYDHVLLGAKISVIGELSNTAYNQATATAYSGVHAPILAAVDNFAAESIVIATSTDPIAAQSNATLLLGTASHDDLSGGASSNFIFGGNGADEIFLTGGGGVVSGGNGSDLIAGYVSGASVTIDGGAGDDLIDVGGSSRDDVVVLFGSGSGHDSVSPYSFTYYEGSTPPVVSYGNSVTVNFGSLSSTDVSLYWDKVAYNETVSDDEYHDHNSYWEVDRSLDIDYFIGDLVAQTSSGDTINLGALWAQTFDDEYRRFVYATETSPEQLDEYHIKTKTVQLQTGHLLVFSDKTIDLNGDPETSDEIWASLVKGLPAGYRSQADQHALERGTVSAASSQMPTFAAEYDSFDPPSAIVGLDFLHMDDMQLHAA